MKHFKSFDAEKHMTNSKKVDKLMVMMFMHVQNELEKYKLLRKNETNQLYSVKKNTKSKSGFQVVI